MLPRTIGQWTEQFNQLADNIRDVLWLYAADYSEVLYISPAYERVWGRTRESLYREPYSFLEAVHPEDRVRAETTIRTEHEPSNVEDVLAEVRLGELSDGKQRTLVLIDEHPRRSTKAREGC